MKLLKKKKINFCSTLGFPDPFNQKSVAEFYVVSGRVP